MNPAKLSISPQSGPLGVFIPRFVLQQQQEIQQQYQVQDQIQSRNQPTLGQSLGFHFHARLLIRYNENELERAWLDGYFHMKGALIRMPLENIS